MAPGKGYKYTSRLISVLLQTVLIIANIQFCLATNSTIQREFMKAVHCMASSCSETYVNKVRSKIECATTCRENNYCDGFRFTSLQDCYHFPSGCFNSATCDYSGLSGKYFEKRVVQLSCQHGGQYDMDLQACRCIDGWVGTVCERRPYRCEELMDYYYPQGNQLTLVDIHRTGQAMVNTTCIISSSTAYTVILQSNGWLPHNFTWQEYVNGYYLDRSWGSNMFIGLENMYQMTRLLSYQEVRVVLTLNKTSSPTAYRQWQSMNMIAMGDGTQRYPLTYVGQHASGKSGTLNLSNPQTLGDVMGMSANVPFSTYDQDNDDDSTTNCAALSGAGWWFHNCSLPVNPLGVNYKYMPGGSDEEHIRFPGINTTDPQVISYYAGIMLIFVP